MEGEPYQARGRERVALRVVLAYKILRHGSRRFTLPGGGWPVVIVVLKSGTFAAVNTMHDPPRKEYADAPYRSPYETAAVARGTRDLLTAADSLCSLILYRDGNALDAETRRSLDALCRRLRGATEASRVAHRD